MALDPRYIVASDLESYFVDKDSGLPLANGTLNFYRDIARTTPKEVFQLSGSPPNYTYTSMGSVITLSAVGTVQNSVGDNEVIYYFPFDSLGNIDLYFVDVRSEGGIQQFTREAWPNDVASGGVTEDQTPLDNQISNPTFTNVLINEGKTTIYTVVAASNQVFEFAPNWDFVISGSGTVTVQRLTVAGNSKVITSPPYVIDVDISSGITQCYLRQRFNTNSGLWSSTLNNNIFLNGAFVARNQGAGTTGLQMFYKESTGGVPVLIVDGSFQNSYTLISGSVQIPQSTNTDVGINGYIDIYLSFLQGTHIQITSIQLFPSAGNAVTVVSYDKNSSNRDEALQGDYYLPRSIAKTINSYLVGWDFPYNPFQFGLTGNIDVAAKYIADQTIAARGATGNVIYGHEAVLKGIQFATAGTNDAFYMLQYLSGNEVRNMIGSRLSANVSAFQSAVGDPATVRVYLFRAPAATVIPAIPITIGTIAATGVFTLTAVGWTEIPRSGLDTAQANLAKIAGADLNLNTYDYGFTGWQITDPTQIVDTDKFAIVVTFHYPDTSTVITVRSISLVPGDLPCRPPVQTTDEVLRQCQYYYEKSYPVLTPPGTVTNAGSILIGGTVFNNAGVAELFVKSFTLMFKTTKRVNPSVIYYSPVTGAPNTALAVMNVPGFPPVPSAVPITDWIVLNLSQDNEKLLANASGVILPVGNANSIEGFFEYHYTADARLGIV